MDHMSSGTTRPICAGNALDRLAWRRLTIRPGIGPVTATLRAFPPASQLRVGVSHIPSQSLLADALESMNTHLTLTPEKSGGPALATPSRNERSGARCTALAEARGVAPGSNK